MRIVTCTLYVPNQPPRHFLSMQTAFEAVPEGCRYWRISRLVMHVGQSKKVRRA